MAILDIDFAALESIWPDPPWLTNSPDAQQALKTLEAKGRDRLWLIGYLVLLRRDYEKPATLRTVKAAARRFTLAASKVSDAVASLLRYAEEIVEPEDAKAIEAAEKRLHVREGSIDPHLDKVPIHLEAVKLSLERAQRFVKRNSLRRDLKVSLVCEARGPGPRDFHDMEVSALINAATTDFSKDAYSADAHKDWRRRQKALSEKHLAAKPRQRKDIGTLFDPH